MKMKIFTIALFYIVLIFNSGQISFSQVNQEWVARFNGPGDTTDLGYCVAVDDSGNVYAAGTSLIPGSFNNYVVVKYNSSGVQQWIATYNNGNDDLNSLAVDDSGNVYVTGSSTAIGTDLDYATLKFNSSGVLQWIARYDGPGNSTDEAQKIALDKSGNVFVTGRSFTVGSNYDFATIKYNSSGVQQWVARYNGPGSDYDDAVSLAVDNSGNIYVSGCSFASETGIDCATIKYNSSGVQQWIARYNRPGSPDDRVYSMALDNSENVYVTGRSTDINYSNSDFTTIKYNSSGVQQWVASYNGPANSSDDAVSVAVDNTGNVFMTGSSIGSGLNSDFATIKYSSSGIQQWVKRYNGTSYLEDWAQMIALDSSGNVYVTGSSYDFVTNYDFTTIKYNSEGVEQWKTKYNGPIYYDEFSSSIAVDTRGNVYVTGLSYSSFTNLDIVTIKYSQPTGIMQLSSEIPEQFSLTQNYPNPFNPSTIINYELRITNYVKLVVFDALGKEVTKLVNEKQSPGTYQVEFDARLAARQGNNLPSGVYFYRLTAGEFTDTKRMILVK